MSRSGPHGGGAPGSSGPEQGASVIHLRPATLDDADFMLRLRNDPETRLNSHNTAMIARADHMAWLADALKGDLIRIYVASVDERPVGTVRVDDAVTHKMLSWMVAPEPRGRGHGARMVRAVVDRTPELLRAEVKSFNVASRRIAERAGLLLDREADGVCRYAIDAP